MFHCVHSLDFWDVFHGVLMPMGVSKVSCLALHIQVYAHMATEISVSAGEDGMCGVTV
jgi:hypothetical protein